MAESFTRDVRLGQSPVDAVEVGGTSTTVDGDLAVLRKVVEDLRWTCEAIAAHMGRDESYKSHVWRVLNGERPMSHEFLKALPDEIEIEWHSRLAEQGGRYVVTPSVDPMRDILSGIAGMSRASQLPVKTAGQLKVNLDVPRKAVR